MGKSVFLGICLGHWFWIWYYHSAGAEFSTCQKQKRKKQNTECESSTRAPNTHTYTTGVRPVISNEIDTQFNQLQKFCERIWNKCNVSCAILAAFLIINYKMKWVLSTITTKIWCTTILCKQTTTNEIKSNQIQSKKYKYLNIDLARMN